MKTNKSFAVLFLAAAALACVSCGKIDDLDQRLTVLEGKVAELERLCNQFNGNIATLSAAVTVLEGKDYVTGVTEIKEEGAVVGYEINFSKSGPCRIYHGKDGYTPVMGIAAGEDGLYYWTLDGEFILDEDGNAIKAGAEDGITPEFKIEEGFWFVRYGAGEWIKYGQATGDKGDSMFQSATLDEQSFTLVLADGSSVTIPIGLSLSIDIDTSTSITVSPGISLSLYYTIASSTGKADIAVIPTSGIKAKVIETGLSGAIQMVLSEDMDFEYDKVTVIVTNGFLTVVKIITFEEGGVIVLTDDSTGLVTCKGGIVTVGIVSNVDCYVSIDSEDGRPDWIRQVSTRALSYQSLDFSVEANEGDKRTAVITVWSPAIDSSVEFTVVQYGKTASFAVTSSGSSAKVPDISGSGLNGLVDWEDGTEEWNPSVSRSYGSSVSRTAEYFVEGATGFSFDNLTGLAALDVSEF